MPATSTRREPADEYRRRQADQQQQETELRQREAQVSRARMASFLGALLLAIGGSRSELFSPWWSLLPLASFAALVWYHESVIRLRQRAERAAAFYGRGLARLEERWSQSGEPGDRFLEPTHPYAADLDIFGPASLFQFLSTARTRGGEERLAQWLLTPAPPVEIRRRQQAVAELAPRLDLREDIATVSQAVALHPEHLRRWAVEPALSSTGIARVLALLLVGLTFATIVAASLAILPPGVPVMALLPQGLFAWYWRRRVQRICGDAERALRDLDVLALLLERLEREAFDSSSLRELRARLDSDGAPPSVLIHQLRRRVELLDARRNELFAPLAAMLLWTTQSALAIEVWRRDHATAVTDWLEVVAEVEALATFAAYAYEHPQDAFPELVDPEVAPAEGSDRPAEPGCFHAEALGHPLIADSRNVRNDVRLDEDQRLLIVSGSNMSGKSTLLRAVGVNLVLALAGAPVRARRLRLTPLALGASIRVVDSLETGTSRFYAEIKRLRQLVELTRGERPVLFLLDEVLSGTNSHDRRAGAEAVARSLIARGAIGLLTTHDLALASLADSSPLRAANVHLEDSLENGQMSFDYRLRPGVVRKSNALELMRAVGLEV